MDGTWSYLHDNIAQLLIIQIKKKINKLCIPVAYYYLSTKEAKDYEEVFNYIFK